MKANTTKEFLYTGDYYGYVLVQSSDETVTERRYNEIAFPVALTLSVNLLGDLVVESNTKMQQEGYLKNIRDRNGDEIYVGGVWRIFQTAPILGPAGIKAGYRYRATIIEGNI